MLALLCTGPRGDFEMADKNSFIVVSLLEGTPHSLKRRRLYSRHNTPVTCRSKSITPRRRKKRTPKGSHRCVELSTADIHASSAYAYVGH